MPDDVTIHEAKTHFSKLVRQVEEGGEVIVRRGKTPVAKIVKYEEELKPPRRPGALKGQIWIADDFDDLPEDLLEFFE